MNRTYIKSLLIFGITVLFGSNGVLQAQQVSGEVTDSTGETLPGVNIMIKDTTIGTSTNGEGKYVLDITSQEDTLVFSFVGFQTKEVPVNGRKKINVKMSPKIISGSQLVVVGYGKEKRKNVVGSISSVDIKSAKKVVSNDIGEMLRGQVPGLKITTADAGPGGSSNFLIRGMNSLSASSKPLILVDGVPVERINTINPVDIKSISVLKDAASTAIYGARGANGVILITTRNAKKGVHVSYNGYGGIQMLHKNFDVYNGQEYAQLKREGYRTDNNGLYLPDSTVFTPIEQEVLKTGDYVNWFKKIFQIAPETNQNISISTGTDRSKLYMSGNFTKEDGIIPGTNDMSGSLRIKGSQKIGNWLNIGIDLYHMVEKKNRPGTGATLTRAITASPLAKVYNDDGTLKLHPNGLSESFNPLSDLHEVKSKHKIENSRISMFANVDLTKDLAYRFTGSRTSWLRRINNYSSSKSVQGQASGGKGNGGIQHGEKVLWQVRNRLKYKSTFLNTYNHIGFTINQSIQVTNNKHFITNAKRIPFDLLGIYGLETAESTTPTVSASRTALSSVVGRVKYNYANEFYIDGSFRADGASVFGKNNKWAFFPAVAIGWNMTNGINGGLLNSKLVQTLKLRISYGTSGNMAINPYQSLNLASERDYLFGGEKAVGFTPGNYLPNPNLRWETSTISNVALDFAILNNRLSGTIEVYDNVTNDLLVSRAIQSGSGYTREMTNIGQVENKGIEMDLKGVVVQKKDFHLNTGLTFSSNRNTINHLYGLDKNGDGKEDNDIGNGWFIGHPINVYYGYKAIGIYQADDNIAESNRPNAKPGDIKLFDRYPSDGKLNSEDRVIIPLTPKWYGSFYFNGGIKNIDFSARFYTVQGLTKHNPFLYSYGDGADLRGDLNGLKVHYWTPEAPSNNYPRPSHDNTHVYMPTLGFQNASYVRLQNITIGYSLPNNILTPTGLTKFRIYASAHNLLTFTNYLSYGPEGQADQYPNSISIVLGLQIKL
jgi:TonB-linked SusC/RagA family outer membrane protein